MWQASKEIEKLEDRVKKLEKQRHLDHLVNICGAIRVGGFVIDLQTYKQYHQLAVMSPENDVYVAVTKGDVSRIITYLDETLKRMELDQKSLNEP